MPWSGRARSRGRRRLPAGRAPRWYFAYGNKFDEAALKPLEPGSFYTEPPSQPHFAMTKDEVIIQVSGVGPSSTTYVDPANDPTRR